MKFKIEGGFANYEDVSVEKTKFFEAFKNVKVVKEDDEVFIEIKTLENLIDIITKIENTENEYSHKKPSVKVSYNQLFIDCDYME